MNRYDFYWLVAVLAVLAVFGTLVIVGGIYHEDAWGVALLVIGGIGFTIVGCISFLVWCYMTFGFRM